MSDVQTVWSYRNILTTVLRNAKINYYSGFLAENSNNTSKTWNIINELLSGRNKGNKGTKVEKNYKAY